MHALQLESVRLEELIDRVRHRTGQIDTEMQEIEANEREARSSARKRMHVSSNSTPSCRRARKPWKARV